LLVKIDRTIIDIEIQMNIVWQLSCFEKEIYKKSENF
jgi:hypothetical protein